MERACILARLESLKLDAAKQVEGRWVEFAAGVRFKIARMNNPKHREKQHKLSRPHLRKLRKMDTALAERIAREAMVGTVLLDWENIEDEKGKSIPYSEKKALELLTAPEFEHIYNFVRDEAADDEEYLLQTHEESAGN